MSEEDRWTYAMFGALLAVMLVVLLVVGLIVNGQKDDCRARGGEPGVTYPGQVTCYAPGTLR